MYLKQFGIPVFFALTVSLLFHHICPFCCETNDVQNGLIVSCWLLTPYSYLIINILILFINSNLVTLIACVIYIGNEENLPVLQASESFSLEH